MSEELSIFEKRQAYLLLITLQMIVNSSDNVEELKRLLKRKEKEEAKEDKKSPKPEISKQENPEKDNVIQKQEYTGMIKSILSQAPPLMNKFNPLYQKQRPMPQLPEEKTVVKPAEVKPKRVEMPLPEKHPAQVLRVPQTRLPPEFQYLRPTPTTRDIDLGKINPLLHDPAIQLIECKGPDQSISVSGAMGTKPTGIVLDNKEVEDIVSRFSAASKIPADNGVYKVAIGRLVFSAVISDIVPSRFTIRKMRLPNPVTQISRNPNQRPQVIFRR